MSLENFMDGPRGCLFEIGCTPLGLSACIWLENFNETDTNRTDSKTEMAAKTANKGFMHFLLEQCPFCFCDSLTEAACFIENTFSATEKIHFVNPVHLGHARL